MNRLDSTTKNVCFVETRGLLSMSDGGRILCDGDFGLMSDYLMLTPFTKRTVQVGWEALLRRISMLPAFLEPR